MYGADIWGYKVFHSFQIAENKFIRGLLRAPQSTPSYMAHEELGLGYVKDAIVLRPVKCWLSVWWNTETTMNKLIIKDCLNLNNHKAIPWLGYVKKTLTAIGEPDLFFSPSSTTKSDMNLVKNTFMANMRLLREEG